VAGGAGAGAEALSRRGGTQGAAAGLHLPSMLIASRGPDRDLELWSEIPKSSQRSTKLKYLYIIVNMTKLLVVLIVDSIFCEQSTMCRF